MVTKKRMYGFVLAFSFVSPAFSMNLMQDMKPLLVSAAGKTTTAVEQVMQDVLFSPAPYAGVLGLGALTLKSKEYPVLVAVAYGGMALYHSFVFRNWWRLSVEYNQLKQTSTEGDLLERNAWGDDTQKCTGYALWKYFIGLSNREKKRFARTIQEQVNNQPIKNALHEIQNQLNKYEKSSNILYVLAREAEFSADPKELLTSDYLLKHDIEEEGSLLKQVFKKNTSGSFIAKSFTLRWKWSDWLGAPMLASYGWSYQKASLCIWELIHQYARLKAVAKILEIVPTGEQEPLLVEARIQRS